MALAIILSIGIIPVIASTVRLCEIVMSGTPIQKGTSWVDGDSSWTWAWVPVWSQIEVDVGIVAASLPSFNPLLLKLWKDFAESTSSGHSTFPRWLQRKGSQGSSSTFGLDIEKVPDVRFIKAYVDERSCSPSPSRIGVAITADTRVSVKQTEYLDFKLNQIQA